MDIQLDPGQSALFGYGSLLLRESMEATLGHPYQGPRFYCSVRGWRRTWDSLMPNRSFYYLQEDKRVYPAYILYLNATRCQLTSLNGVIYLVSQAELDLFDEREWIYDRHDVTEELADTTVSGGRVFMYVGVDPYLLKAIPEPQFAAVRESYVEMIDRGLDSLGGQALSSYQASTDELAQSLLVRDLKDADSNPFRAERRAQVERT